MASVLDHMKFAQVGYVVKDIDAARESYAKLFGVPVPRVQPSGYGAANTVYKGNPVPDSHCKLAFFSLSSGVQLELIEPDEGPSTWREYLDAHGEGIHHIAFIVKDMDRVVRECMAEGMTVVQQGNYDDNSGHYTYLDGSEKYKCVIELLESFPRK
ncbi:MAG: VOC family protein [Clostridia bacterium]|nr:VOC family protein [Clostridia bacterium]